jgi:hypothetical protein
MRATVSEALISKPDAFHRWGGRVPILLGAAGHRRIDSRDARLADAIRDDCVRLRKRYKHSPFVVLSALAEGADRLVARVAMKELSAELIAVLPMPRKEYERDFQSEESKAEFRDFLSRALFVKEAPVPQGDASWTVEGEPRNRQYARAGAIVADHAQVLFAIWDGKPARGTGGTGDQVAWFDANPLERAIQFWASWGEVQTGAANCMIADVFDPATKKRAGRPYIIGRAEFEETYSPVRSAWYWR